jgi:hypothetical protein
MNGFPGKLTSRNHVRRNRAPQGKIDVHWHFRFLPGFDDLQQHPCGSFSGGAEVTERPFFPHKRLLWVSENPFLEFSVYFANSTWYFMWDFARFSYSIRTHSKVYEKHVFSVTTTNRRRPC